MTFAAGVRFGPYEIIAPLGSGGMGIVYRARDARLQRDVALKVLPAPFARDPDRFARFTREAQVLASLNHPNIGSIYGFEQSGDLHALVLELVEGPTLADRIERGPIALDESLLLAGQMLDALEAAHERGVVHRDLKPANIKLRSDGALKVLDFGLAKALTDEAGSDLSNSPTTAPAATRAGVILGTAAYMSPEQARGKAIDKRADIWAFGCVLYEMLAGRPMVAGDTVSDTLVAVLSRDVDWTALPPDIPDAVRRLLQRCLEKDPKRRLRDVGDARLELEEARSAPRGGTTTDSQRTRARALPWIVASAALAVAAFALGRTMGSTSDTGPSFSRVVRLTTGPALEKGPAISPDGKWIAYLSDARGVMDVWVKFLAGGEPANLTASAGLEITSGTGITGLEIEPDGGHIAVMARPRESRDRFETWEIPAPLPGIPRKLLDRGEFGIRWSSDGRQIAFIRAGGPAGDALWMADAAGTNRRELIPARGGLHIHWLSWSRDGYIYFIHTFATIFNLDQAEIYRIDSRGGAMQPVVSTSRRAAFPLPMPDGSGMICAANPSGAELSLWWRPARGGVPKRLTMGVGEYAEPRVSADGRTLVATLYELRQSLIRVVVTDAPATQTTPLTDGYGGDLDPTLVPGTDQIVFTSSRSGNRNIWTAKTDGTSLRPLTTGSALDEHPAVSPDGQQVAFISDRDGKRAIWIVSADGGTPRKIIDAPVLGGLAWSDDGREIIYSGGSEGTPSLWTATIAGGVIRPLPTPGAGAAVMPTRCPTRDLVAFLEPPNGANLSTRLGFVDAAGRAAYASFPKPPIGPGFANGTLAWSPDGRRLAVTVADAALSSSVWIVDPDAPNPYRLLIELPPGPRVRGVTWTRNGSAVIVGKHDASSDIVLLDRTP